MIYLQHGRQGPARANGTIRSVVYQLVVDILKGLPKGHLFVCDHHISVFTTTRQVALIPRTTQFGRAIEAALSERE